VHGRRETAGNYRAGETRSLSKIVRRFARENR